MAARVMVIWILSLVLIWAGVYVFFAKYYDGRDYEKQKVASLENRLNRSYRQFAKLQLSINEYKDFMVASGVKIDNDTKWTDTKRMIASVVADPQYKKVPQPQPGSPLFVKAKKIFTTGDYVRTAEILDDFIQRYPDHPALPEAGYLLSECYFYLDQLESSVRMIDYVLTHFPETEFAGYGLLRLGRIFEKQERLEEAAEMYQVVIANYEKSNAAAMARRYLKELNL
jgi:TolA-binding protein